MGILGKIFGSKDKKQVAEGNAIKGVGVKAKLHEGEKVVLKNTVNIEVATLSYGYHTIPVEAFRQGVKKGATIKAFCDKSGTFIPLSQLGSTLLLSDPLTNTVSPLVYYEGEEYQDIYNYVYTNNNYRHDDDDVYPFD